MALGAAALAVPALFGDAYGHGLGGDVAPAVDFAGMSVTVSTQMSPSDITVGDLDSASLAVRFFDQDTDQTLEQVTYRVAIWRDGGLLARHLFYDDDGNLDIEIRPVYDCTEIDLSDCTKYFGTPHPTAPAALYTRGTQEPVIQGPIFDKGGLYNIQVDIEAATSPKTLLTTPLSFETFVSVAQEQPFTIQTAKAEIPVTVKTYYDDIENFAFNEGDGSISFDMPFDWSPDYVEQVELIHEEVQIPKSFELYSTEKQFQGFVNGIEVDKRVLILDPYSYEEMSVLHFLVTGQELQRINDVLGEEHYQSRTMSFTIVPEQEAQENIIDVELIDLDSGSKTGTNVSVAWDSTHTVGDNIPFELTFLDADGNLLKDIRYGYGLYNHATNEQLAQGVVGDEAMQGLEGIRFGDCVTSILLCGENGLGILSLEGIDFQILNIPSAETYRLDVMVLGKGTVGLDYDSTYYGIGSTLIEVPPALPSWIKTSAGFWVDGQTSDAEFVGAIQYLINEGIIVIPPTDSDAGTGDTSVPAWIKTSAGFWVDGQISDAEFVGAIQFLVEEGVIVV